jgi:hypothetical protein
MKTALLAAALVSTLIGMPQAYACIVANAFQACADGSRGRAAGGGFASPFPRSTSQNVFGSINGQPFFAHQTPNGTFGTLNGEPFFINRF